MVTSDGRRRADGSVRRGSGIRHFAARVLLLAFASSLAAAGLAGQGARAAMDEGVRLLNADKPRDAEKKFEQAIKSEPTVGLYHLWLGRAVGTQAQQASIVRQPFLARRTKAAFEKAVELDPTLIDARDGLIDFYLQAPGFMGGSLEKAKEQQRLIAAQDAMRGHGAAVLIAWHQRDTVATEAALRAMLTSAPDSLVPVIRLGQMQAQWGRTAAAFETYDGYLAKHSDDIAMRFQFARLAAISAQHLSRAERMLHDLLALPDWPTGGSRPSKAAVHFRLGMVQEKSGRKDDARASYETALKLDPNLQLAKDALAALK